MRLLLLPRRVQVQSLRAALLRHGDLLGGVVHVRRDLGADRGCGLNGFAELGDFFAFVPCEVGGRFQQGGVSADL